MDREKKLKRGKKVKPFTTVRKEFSYERTVGAEQGNAQSVGQQTVCDGVDGVNLIRANEKDTRLQTRRQITFPNRG